MTRQEFLKYVEERTDPPYFEQKPYSRENFAGYLNDPRRDNGSSQKIIRFFEDMVLTLFDRTEEKSGDILTVHMFYYHGVNYWQDIGCMVGYCGWISNCSTRGIEQFYISEQGKFYNQDHKLLAENEEDFFDYLVTVEYDFHPEIPQRTYHILRHFGWYEGRHIDTTEFEQKMKKRGIDFTKAQLDFLSEFSGLEFELSDYYYWKVYSLDRISENYVPIAQPDAHRKVRIEDAFGCGDDGNGLIFLSSDGLLALGVNTPLGRTTMECINHLCNDSNENPPWLEKLLKQDEAV